MCDMRYALTEQKREIHLLKELVKAMRISNPNARALGKLCNMYLYFVCVIYDTSGCAIASLRPSPPSKYSVFCK